MVAERFSVQPKVLRRPLLRIQKRLLEGEIEEPFNAEARDRVLPVNRRPEGAKGIRTDKEKTKGHE
jgi:hypothetical protein